MTRGLMRSNESWDTVVIGAGVGGLYAAACLVNAGLRVLVLERNPHIGGTAYVYQRGGFIFPMGPLGFSSPRLVKSLLEGIGADRNIILQPVNYQLRALGVKLILSASFEDLKDQCKKLFPGEEEGIDTFFKDVDRLAVEMMEAGINNPSPLLEGAAATPASTYLRGLVRDQRLRRILGSMGAREPYSNLPLLASMWDLLARQGIHYPREGMAHFCRLLAEKVAASPPGGGVGEIRLGAEVSGITVKRSRARGVTIKDGTSINSATVISNADFKTTYLKLLERRVVPPEWLDAVSRAKQTHSNFQVCLGLDSGQLDLSAFSEGSRIIYRKDEDRERTGTYQLRWSAPQIEPEDLTSQEIEVSLWTADDRTLSPPGGEVLVIRTAADYLHFNRYRPSWGKRNPAYQKYKKRLAFALIKEVENLVPGLERAIRVIDVATPLTFEERGGRSQGAIAGWSWDFRNSREFQAREMVRTPLKGLYMAGYQAFSTLFSGGVPSAMESGRRAAQAVLSGAEPAGEVTFSFPDES